MVQLLDQFGPRVGAAWDSLVSEVFQLEQLNEALAAVASGRVVKALVQPNPGHACSQDTTLLGHSSAPQ